MVPLRRCDEEKCNSSGFILLDMGSQTWGHWDLLHSLVLDRAVWQNSLSQNTEILLRYKACKISVLLDLDSEPDLNTSPTPETNFRICLAARQEERIFLANFCLVQ